MAGQRQVTMSVLMEREDLTHSVLGKRASQTPMSRPPPRPTQARCTSHEGGRVLSVQACGGGH